MNQQQKDIKIKQSATCDAFEIESRNTFCLNKISSLKN